MFCMFQLKTFIIVQDSEHEEKPRSKKEVKLDDGQGLGTVQISVTAATPMVEDADKSFLNDIIKEEDDEQDQDADHENNVEQLKRDPELEKEVADAVDEILEEARIETSKRPPPKKTRTLDKSDSKDDAKQSAPVKKEPAVVKPPTTDLPSSGPAKVEKPMRSGPPAVPPPPPPVQTAASIDDDNKFEANFEANFDDAFGESDPEPEPEQPSRPELPKQLGGRASIPDELEQHQLERLQDLKESNA